MEVELFGRGGTRVRVEAGDVIVMPAGVSHSMTGHSDDVLMVGGYPDGRDWDNIQEDHITEEVRRAAAKRIMMLPIPAPDPVTGEPMREWIEAPSRSTPASTTSATASTRSEAMAIEYLKRGASTSSLSRAGRKSPCDGRGDPCRHQGPRRCRGPRLFRTL